MTAVLVTHDHEEAFAVADRMAVMRDGSMVQDGNLEEVWGHPADAWTARFLGYATVVEGAPPYACGGWRPRRGLDRRGAAALGPARHR